MKKNELIPILISKDKKGKFVKASEAEIEKINHEIANTITCHEPSFSVHHCNMCIVAMRGRNPDNPSDRTPGIKLEQRLEPNSEGICNTLTTVQNDNLVLEMGSGGGYVPMVVEDKKTDETIKIKQATKQGYIECKNGGVADFYFPDSKIRRGRVQGGGEICPTLMAGNSEIVKIEKNEFYEQAIKTAEENNAQEGDIVDAFNQRVLTDGISPTVTTRPEGKKTAILPVVEKYRIRKLTPRECFRLMNVEEEQFNRAEKVVSNSQLYKIAGNAIVVSVLVAIFSQMNIQGKKNWNSLSKEEREKLVYKNSILENKKCE